MENSIVVKGNAERGIWFVVDLKTNERIAKCKSIPEAVRWANGYIDRKNGK
jgi:hypothetical protein